jgi:hypothetical protein
MIPHCYHGYMDLRYPIGRFEPPASITPELRTEWIEELAFAPTRFREAIRGLTDEQLDTPYRPGGWTVRQVIHHVPDSHMNCYVRFRLALTEEDPLIRPYDEARWALLEDACNAPAEVSLRLLEGLHDRWVRLIRSLPEPAFARTYRHPERGTIDLETTLALYAWHSRHHAAHITALRDRSAWK